MSIGEATTISIDMCHASVPTNTITGVPAAWAPSLALSQAKKRSAKMAIGQSREQWVTADALAQAVEMRLGSLVRKWGPWKTKSRKLSGAFMKPIAKSLGS